MIISGMGPRHAAFRSLVLGMLMLAAGAAPEVAQAATNDPAVMQNVGAWDLVYEKGNRRCRVTLRDDPVPNGYSVAMPPGCRHAFTNLAAVRSWVPGEGDHLVFQAEAGQVLMDFAPSGGPGLAAQVSETDVYTLTPADPSRLATLGGVGGGAAPAPAAAPDIDANSAAELAPAKAAAAKAKPAPKPAAATRQLTTGEVAGHYAVLRQTRDTGCMVTLEDGKAGSGLKARLAPACRDQGIVIFDPTSWRLGKGEVVLTARRGHSIDLIQQEDGTWANAPAKGPALVLKRL